MKLNYNHLSSGYIGKKYNQATLNSQYYGLFFDEIINSYKSYTSILPFPQRVPRSGFFDEIIALEVKGFKKKVEKTTAVLVNRYMSASADLGSCPAEDNTRKFLNWGNLLLRYGHLDEIMRYFPTHYSGPYELEIKLLRESSVIERQLSNDKSISVNALLLLADKFIPHKETTTREKIMLLNSLIVYFYRHQKISAKRFDIVNYSHSLSKLLETVDYDNFIGNLYASIAFRGLAMVSDFDIPTQNSFIYHAEQLARSLQGENQLEQIVAAENFYTCLQTLSKWSQINNDFTMAERHLLEMIKLDPYDSTGYSELGFLALKMNEIENASLHFEKAMELGPPGTGMNAYYYAKCQEKMGKNDEAINYLYHSASLDRQAISPWLDLLEHYNNNNQQQEAKRIANHIYSTSVLMEQLEHDEITQLQNFIY